jgi:hypothetical protein
MSIGVILRALFNGGLIEPLPVLMTRSLALRIGAVGANSGAENFRFLPVLNPAMPGLPSVNEHGECDCDSCRREGVVDSLWAEHIARDA